MPKTSSLIMLTLSYVTKAGSDQSNFEAMYLYFLLRSPMLNFCKTSFIYLECMMP